MPRSFTSHDPRGAEVRVVTGHGPATVHRKTRTQVCFALTDPALKQPALAWSDINDIATDALFIAIALEASIDWRTECQRRDDISPYVPLAELRLDAKTARSTTTTYVAQVSTFRSGRALTIPAQDPMDKVVSDALESDTMGVCRERRDSPQSVDTSSMTTAVISMNATFV